ncbi:UNVERIFIED_CONTAM: hypothetical protein FKN15_002254, partial [Acipenser sinensis]
EEGSLSTSEEYSVNLYLQVIDIIVTELRNRVSENHSILKGISSLDPRRDTFLNTTVLNYKCDIDSIEAEARLVVHLKVRYEDKEHKKVHTLLKFTSLLHSHKIAFQELYKLCVIAITFPPSSAAAERTFSCIKCLKTYLQNQMGNERLSDVAILTVESALAKQLDLDAVVDKFACNHHNRRTQLM